jgi:dipeptidyl aminopeptidase/acylaminoacyl peptidase
MVKPPGFDRTRKYPLLVEIGDSPRRMCGPDFDLRAQIAAARGYVVMCANPRGTPGYGEVYGNLIHTGLPADAYDDLMRAVDAAVATGYIDPQRLAITGGLLAAWAIGHTDRFHAAVLRRAVADWATHVALAPDGLRRAQAWLGALPWDDPGGYQKRSPIFWAGNFRTPALVLAGGNDAEAEMLYFALKARKVDSALVRIPGDPAPADRILELETVLAWLGR